MCRSLGLSRAVVRESGRGNDRRRCHRTIVGQRRPSLGGDGGRRRSGSALVLCTELAQRPGPGVERVVGAEDLEQVEREIDSARPVDTPAALQLICRATWQGLSDQPVG